MQSTIAAIEKALAIVQRTLDALTTRGDDEAAYEVARAQYSASIRDSWPSNLGSLLSVLEDVKNAPERKLTNEERAELDEAIALLRGVMNQ